MLLAHGSHGSGGGDFVVFGAAMAVFGIVLLIQRTARLQVSLGLILAGAALAAAPFLFKT